MNFWENHDHGMGAKVGTTPFIAGYSSTQTCLCWSALLDALVLNSSGTGSSIRFWPFLAMATIWLASAFLAGRLVAGKPFGFVVFCVFVFAVPIALSGIYTSTLRQTRDLSYYKTSGWVYKLLSRRIIRSLLWVSWALTSSFLMLLQFSMNSKLEWIALCLAIPVFWLVYTKSHQLLAGEFRKPYFVTGAAIFWVRLLGPVLMLGLYAALIGLFADVPSYESLRDALAAKRGGASERTGSAVVQVGLRLANFTDGIKAYLVGNLRQFSEYLPLLMLGLGSYVVFFNACATFACFVIPRHEYPRTIGPLSEDTHPAPLPRSRVASTSALIAFFALFVYVPLFIQLETWLKDHPHVEQTIEELERTAEKIDNALYKPGTIQKLELEKAIALGKINVSQATLEGQIDRAFDRMEQNVDAYLDWYYSLPAEYVRLAKLMAGEVEGYMATELHAKLQQGESFKDISNAVASALANYKNVKADYERAVKAILDANRLPVAASGVTVVRNISLTDILAIPTPMDRVTIGDRAAGGAVAAGVTAAITAKVVSKGMFKAAAQALSKLVISKAAAILGGAAVGATVGSVVPGVGTVIVGAIGGVLAGLAVDAALLKLEEVIRREDFKKEIIAAVRETKSEFKARLFEASKK